MKLILVVVILLLAISLLLAYFYGRPAFLSKFLIQNRIVPLSHPILDLRGHEEENYLYQTGWLASKSLGEPVTKDDKPLPWLTYPFIAFVEERLTQDMDMFEFGAGASTLWFAARVRSIVSVETEKTWYEKVSSKAPSNATVVFSPDTPRGEYAATITLQNRSFHIVLIDGEDRVNCAKAALDHITEDGVIIWDDAARNEYEEGFRILREKGFKRLGFQGMAPVNKNTGTTAVFYRRNNCLNI